MPMKYCNTCQQTQNSTKWDSNRCLNCGNPFNAMALTTSAPRNTTALSLITNSASSGVVATINEANRSGSSADYTHAKGNLASGDYRAEQLQYDPNSGDYSYTKVVFKK